MHYTLGLIRIQLRLGMLPPSSVTKAQLRASLIVRLNNPDRSGRMATMKLIKRSGSKVEPTDKRQELTRTDKTRNYYTSRKRASLA